jgi:5-formaminoimidazole-4-carboxamide-1-(beta)-D-ribofuranosyl 5'-monophosphate synthetase
MKKKLKIAVFGSHSALQILKGAKDEGFKNICICVKGTEEPYKSFRVADEIIIVDSYEDFFRIEKDIIKKEAVLVPHASMISYLGVENIKKIQCMHFGDKKILEIESDREKQRAWLMASGLTTPKIFSSPDDIDRL